MSVTAHRPNRSHRIWVWRLVKESGLVWALVALIVLRWLQAATIAAPAFLGRAIGWSDLVVVGGAVFALRGAYGAVRAGAARRMRTAYVNQASEQACSVSALAVPSEDPPELWFFRALSAVEYLVIDGYPSISANVLVVGVLGPIALSRLRPDLALISGVIAAIAALSYAIVAWFHQRALALALEQERHLVNAVVALVQGHVELLASGRVRDHLAGVSKDAASWSREQQRATIFGGLGGQIPALLVAAATAAGWVGVSAGTSRTIETGDLLLLVGVAPAVIALAQATIRTRTETLCLDAFLATLDGPTDPAQTSSGHRHPDAEADVVFENVTFSYGYDNAIEGLSFRWRKHEILAVSGPNGVGKSTVLRLLLRLADPIAGTVLIGDSTLPEIDIGLWRDSIAFCSQRPFFHANWTVRDALTSLATDAPDVRLRECLQRVELASRLEGRFKDALAVPIHLLSAGERQRVAIARVLVTDRPFLVFDEPEANLDREGARMLAAVFAEQCRWRRVLVAAHEPHVLACAHRIVALDSRATTGADRRLA